MVGVAGRSKGCRTCRKRKKGCDLKRPACAQCEERDLVCGGYDLDRVFIPQKSHLGSSRTARSNASIAESVPRRQSGENSSFQIVRRNVAHPGHLEILLPTPLARSAYTEKSMEMFWDIYLPASPSPTSVRTPPWTSSLANVLPTLCVKDETLRIALLALSSAAAGQARDDQWMIEQGKVLYGKALNEMTRAVRDPKRARSEALLAVPRVMGLFEILFGADMRLLVQANSWQSHAEGELALMRARGPRGLINGAAHQLFVDGRLNAIIAGTRLRKASLMNTKTWKTIPWEQQPKTAKDSLLDILAGMPEILEDLDQLSHRHTTSPEDFKEAIAKCWKLDEELDKWLALHHTQLHFPDSDKPIPITFPDHSIAHLTVLYWTTAAILHQALTDTLSTLELSPSSPPTPNPQKHPRYYARRIARSVPYFLNPTSGIWGAVNIAFPAGWALLCLRRGEEDTEYTMLIYRAWGNPRLPMAIQKFLLSMRNESQRRFVERHKTGQ